LTAACCPSTHTHASPPPPLKNGNRLLYSILKKGCQKACPKKAAKKVAKKAAKKAARKVGKKFIPEPVLLPS